MLRRHDYRCPLCEELWLDALMQPLTCGIDGCEGKPQITYAYWGDVQVMNHGRPTQELTDRNGYRKKFTALEDPLLQIETGLHQDQSSNGIRSFSEEQAKHYREKITRDGDTVQLRDEMLAVRQQNKSAPSS